MMKKTVFVFAVSFAMGLALLGLYGVRVHAQSAPSLGVAAAPAGAGASLDQLDSGVREVTDAYALIEKNFASEVPADRAFYQGAIPGMLETLDPHSSFLDPSDYADMQRKQRAQYSGVGMLISVDNGNTVALEPFPGSPAQQAGFRRGDIIASVDGVNTLGMNSQKVADMLRGQRGTTVHVTVQRPGVADPITFAVVRGDIQTSVVDAYWLQPGVVYLGISSFEAQNVSKDVEDAFAKLGESKVTGMVLDLRGNPGGLVNEAVAVVGRFLRNGQTVVSDRGRAQPERVYTAKAQPLAQDYPIVTLVNGGSASASEIVSGALQDHDRAWLIGATTFGKGLVQAQFPLAEGAALLLTIAHYYTPSGRLIQRDYNNQSFFDYYYSPRKDDAQSETDVKATDSGRKVYGGGGITPDEKYTAPSPCAPLYIATPNNRFQARVYGIQNEKVLHFGSLYFGGAQPQLPSPSWAPDADTIERFKTYLRSQQVPFTDEEFAANRQWISDDLRLELLQRAYDKNTAVRALMQDDPEVHKAIESMPKASALLSRRGATQRAALR
jgi:carboxyl-terminal processing protease